MGVTNWEGGRQAAEHLLDLGHVRFGLIGGERRALYSRARLDGFRSALAARDLDVDETLVAAAAWDREAAREVVAGFLDRPDRPTAVFAASDMMALGVYDAARQLGLDVPGDLSVVGFDDIPEATWASPPLTTVRQPIQEMGASALRMLLRLQDRPTDAGSQAVGPRVDLATRLVERASTGRVQGT